MLLKRQKYRRRMSGIKKKLTHLKIVVSFLMKMEYGGKILNRKKFSAENA